MNKKILTHLEERLEKGKREYTEELDVHDGRDWEIECLEELLDSCIYLTARILQLREKRTKEESKLINLLAKDY